MPNLRLLQVCSLFSGDGEQVTINTVLELPPNESSRILVSFDARYGMYEIDFSDKAQITMPNADSDLFRDFAVADLGDVGIELGFSTPAKSTKYNLLLSVPTLGELCWTVNEKIVCPDWDLFLEFL